MEGRGVCFVLDGRQYWVHTRRALLLFIVHYSCCILTLDNLSCWQALIIVVGGCMSTTVAVIAILLAVLVVWEVMASILAIFSFP